MKFRFFHSFTNAQGRQHNAGVRAGHAVHTRGWDAGIKVTPHAGEDGRDAFTVQMTTGSHDAGASTTLGTVHDTPAGPVWTPAGATSPDAEIITRAEALGTEAGRAAASWVFDGNTPRATYARVLAGIEDGDPEVMDAYREPSLSGEFADDPTPRSLARDLGIDGEPAEYQDAACDAWADAASAAFWAEIEKTARAALA